MKAHRLFFFLTVLLIPTQLGYHMFPEWSMVLGRRIDYLAPTVFLTDCTIGLMLITWIPTEVRFLRDILKRPELRVWRYAMIAIILLAALNIFFSVSPHISTWMVLKIIEYAFLGIYILVEKPSRTRTAQLLTIGVIYSSTIALIQFARQHSLGGVMWFLGERPLSQTQPGIASVPSMIPGFGKGEMVMRTYGTFPHPNVLGGYLAAMGAILIRVKTNRMWETALRFLAGGLGLAALIVTFSRSAWIATALGIAIISINRILRHGMSHGINRTKPIMTLVIIGTVMAMVFIGILPYFRLLTPESESVVLRNELAGIALRLWKTSPILGVGLGTFITRLPDLMIRKNVFFLQPVHSIYLLVLTETGVAGALTVVLGFLWWLWRTRRQILNSGWSVATLLLLFIGLVDHYPITLQQGQLLLTLCLSMSIVDASAPDRLLHKKRGVLQRM